MNQLILRLGCSGIALLAFFITGCCKCGTPAENPTSAKEKVSAGEDDSNPDCCSEPADQKTVLAVGRSGSNPLAAWPMFGGSLSRNMVNAADKNMPTEWVVEKDKQKNIKWVAQLGDKSHGGPVIANGKVYIGTNNKFPRDPKIKGLKAVLMCFAEADGKFLWQAVHDYPADELFKDGQFEGLCSAPAVDGKRLYYVTPACELICADADTGKGVWQLDMMKDLKVVPYHLGNCSPLVAGDLVFVVTSNGINDDGNVASPKAPSFIAVNKENGKVAWQNNLPGERIIEGQWSNPAYGIINGKPQVVFPGGDNYLYSFEPATGKMIWKCNLYPNPPKAKDGDRKITPPYAIATPVIYDNKVYLGLGLYPEHASICKFSYFLCIDMTKTGDVSPVSLDAKAPQNKNSALVWAFGGPADPKLKRERAIYFGKTMSTAAIHDGLVYVAEDAGYLHCLDAKTGKEYWDHDLLAGIWGSPLWVDNKVYIGTENAEIAIFAHGKEKKLLAGGGAEGSQVEMGAMVHGTPVAVNGTLYVATPKKLYAIRKK
jgi:outer membrane protein assembly factor BamB